MSTMSENSLVNRLAFKALELQKANGLTDQAAAQNAVRWYEREGNKMDAQRFCTLQRQTLTEMRKLKRHEIFAA